MAVVSDRPSIWKHLDKNAVVSTRRVLIRKINFFMCCAEASGDPNPKPYWGCVSSVLYLGSSLQPEHGPGQPGWCRIAKGISRSALGMGCQLRAWQEQEGAGEHSLLWLPPVSCPEAPAGTVSCHGAGTHKGEQAAGGGFLSSFTGSLGCTGEFWVPSTDPGEQWYGVIQNYSHQWNRGERWKDWPGKTAKEGVTRREKEEIERN